MYGLFAGSFNADGGAILTAEYRNAAKNTGDPDGTLLYGSPDGAFVEPTRT